jgi:hypothetical protein
MRWSQQAVDFCTQIFIRQILVVGSLHGSLCLLGSCCVTPDADSRLGVHRFCTHRICG